MLPPVSSRMSMRKAKCVLVFMGKPDSTRPRPIDTYAPVASRQVSYGNQTS
jgi:hypothetical protein